MYLNEARNLFMIIWFGNRSYEKYDALKTSIIDKQSFGYGRRQFTFAHMNRPLRLLFFSFVFMSIWACRDDDSIFTSSSAMLNMSTDTVFFDTVFTSFIPGVPMSVNKQFVVRNPYKDKIKTNVDIVGGSNSYFRINVDGEVGPSIKNLEILPGDSVFVFVEVSVEPNQDPQSLPLIIRDSIRFTTNGNSQHVQLAAWGQDGHYFLRDTLCDAVLDDKLKPYVVHGYLYVPENCVLTIKPGVRMHFAPRSWLYVEGTLKIEGTNEEPVYFEGDRLQPTFEEEAGQWGGIWLNHLSKANRIDHARIKNGTVGIYCDSSSVDETMPMVYVTNTLVRNMSFDGLSGKESYIKAENSVFDNCGRYSFLGLWGGKYDLKHCDFLTYGYYFSRRDPTFVLNNVETDEFGRTIRIFDIEADVRNNIIYGSTKEEVGFGLIQDRVVSFVFDCNLAKTEQALDKNGLKNVLNQDPLFVDYRSYDYHLDSLSPAIDMCTDVGVQFDLEGKMRDAKPDAGAYER